MIWSTLFFLGFAQLCISKPLSKRWDDLSLKHSWADVPHGWKYHSPAPPEYIMDLRIGLKQDKLDELISSLYEVSDPAHPRYGVHLSAAEVDALSAPHPDSVGLVYAWLIHHDIDRSSCQRSSRNDWIILRISVTQAERLLGTKYNVYYHAKTSEYVVRTLSYSLPSILLGHVDVIAPTTYFGTVRTMKKTSFLDPKPTSNQANQADAPPDLSPNSTDPGACNLRITPACLRALYKTDQYTPEAADKNMLGVAGYLREFANRADLQVFLKELRPDAAGATFNTVLVNGGEDDQSNAGTEANLDIQYTESISFPTPNTYFSTGGSPPFKPDSFTPTNTNEPYLDWLDFILAQTTIPQTITTSYGDNEQSVPQDYAVSVCDSFMKLGAMGVSILFSSGDFGVGAGDCKTNDGKNTTQFQPVFPASCPFVTAVGGTTQVNPEVVFDISGGGFSNYFAAPPYQSAATSAFLGSLGTKYAGLFNKSGRAYPDVAAQGQDYQVVINGTTFFVSGTSASSPTFAGVISLLNDVRIASGKSPLGFLNPFLYSYGIGGLNDITSGNNPGCGTDGFSACVGWDPVSGLGTPDFRKLKDIVAYI